MKFKRLSDGNDRYRRVYEIPCYDLITNTVIELAVSVIE